MGQGTIDKIPYPGWDGTNMVILPAVNDTGSVSIGNGTLDMDFKVFLGSAAKYVLFDVGNSRVYSTVVYRNIVTITSSGNEEGVTGYFEGHIAGTTTGHTYGLGSWFNVDTGAVLSAGHIIVPIEGGVYTSEAQAAARIVFAGQHQAILTGAPASLHAWRLNTTQTITALITAANSGSVGFTAGTGTSGTQRGYIPIADVVGVGLCYIRVYATAT